MQIFEIIYEHQAGNNPTYWQSIDKASQFLVGQGWQYAYADDDKTVYRRTHPKTPIFEGGTEHCFISQIATED